MSHAEDLEVPDARLESIYREHYDFVRRTLRYLGVPESRVLDAVQDVFLVVLRRLKAFEGRSAIQTWLFGIALRVAHGDRRRNGRVIPPELAILRLSWVEGGPDDAVARRQAADLLAGLLLQLDDDQRAVFVLSEVEQFSAPEIAKALDVKINTVYSRLRLGRKKFERALARYRARERGRGA